jgi:hypothetical protein
VSAYLCNAPDESAGGRWFGKVSIANGAPITESTTDYQPGVHSDFWGAMFPTHDYPAHLAEVCIALWQQTGNATYRSAAYACASRLRSDTPGQSGRFGYAEHYGRWIHFLLHAGNVFSDQSLVYQAHCLADEAIDQLMTDRMFRTHTGEDRYDAVDGLGLLAIALLALYDNGPGERMTGSVSIDDYALDGTCSTPQANSKDRVKVHVTVEREVLSLYQQNTLRQTEKAVEHK